MSFLLSSSLSPGDTASALPTDSHAQPSSSPSPSLSQPPSSLLTSSLSPPLIVGFISVGAFAVAIISICAWSRFVGRPVLPNFLLSSGRYLPAAFRRQEGQRGQEEEEVGEEEGGQFQQWGRGRRRRGGASASAELVKAKPVMFDAWIGKRRTPPLRSADILKWEAESVPFSATLFTTGAVETASCMVDVSSRVGGDSVEEEDEEKPRLREGGGRRHTGNSSSTLQVAVLLQMPSPSHAESQSGGGELLGYRGELAIGLIEVPWAREDHEGT